MLARTAFGGIRPSARAITLGPLRSRAHLSIITGNGPVKPPGEDERRIAQPLHQNVYSQLTPTLRKFTLPNKVAVVTG